LGKKSIKSSEKPRDRTFLKVAINSQDHFLCSHDFEDFTEPKRVEIKNRFDVRVKTVGETLLFLEQTGNTT
jgi:hypothetical protein